MQVNTCANVALRRLADDTVFWLPTHACCCGHDHRIPGTNTHANAISTYIDIDKLRRFHPLIISHAEFLAREDKDALWRYTTKV